MDEPDEGGLVVCKLVEQVRALVAVASQLERRVVAAVFLSGALLAPGTLDGKILERGKRPGPQRLRVVGHPRKGHHKRRRVVSLARLAAHPLFLLLVRMEEWS